MRETEAEARLLTLRAYFRRNVGRLFPVPDIDARHPDMWPKLDDAFYSLAVGVIPPLDAEPPSLVNEGIIAGIWMGIGPGIGGTDLRLLHFGHPGCTTHRSPYGIGFVHVLPPTFQRIAERTLRVFD